MRRLRKEEAFTGLLITHDLRESVFLADQIVVLSSRPTSAQRIIDVPLGPDRSLDDLYTAETTALLSELRSEIEIAKTTSGPDLKDFNRQADAPAPSSATPSREIA